MASARLRLDKLLLERGLVSSRARAAALILAGQVLVDGQRAIKAGQLVRPDANVEVVAAGPEYVSRGGNKLAGALDDLGLEVAGLVVVDVGASTGGFTHCLLRRGARRVYAVDVGYGQLDWSLRRDPRVVVREKVNARYLTDAILPEPLDLAVIDVSFISLRKIVPSVLPFVKAGGRILALIKPQFEVGRGQVGKGVVRDPELHRQVVDEMGKFFTSLGMSVEKVVPSRLLGPKGNREFFIAALKGSR